MSRGKINFPHFAKYGSAVVCNVVKSGFPLFYYETVLRLDNSLKFFEALLDDIALVMRENRTTGGSYPKLGIVGRRSAFSHMHMHRLKLGALPRPKSK